MSLFQQKFTAGRKASLINLIATIAFLAHVFSPAIAKADIVSDFKGDTTTPKAIINTKINQDITIAESPEGRMISAGKFGAPDAVIDAVITAYTSTIDQTDDDPFIAATGKRVYDGMIAGNGMPFGTKIRIPSLYGDKIFTVDDRMNRRYGFGRLDIWLDTSKKEAFKFGVKRVKVEIYYPDRKIAIK